MTATARGFRDRPAPRPPRRPTVERLTRSALAYLERYASSAESLRRVLARRVERYARSPEAEAIDAVALIEEVLRRCAASGLIDDKVYAAHQVARLRRQGRSRAAITARLRSKGVPTDEIAASVAGDKGTDEAAARRAAQRKRLGPWRSRDRAERRERDIAALCRAGFSVAIAKAAIDEEIEPS